MNASHIFAAALALSGLTLGACGPAEPAVARFGIDVDRMLLEVFRTDAGIAPSKSILADPNNPFVSAPPSIDTAFALLGSGQAPVATYYAWGTLLAVGAPIDPGVSQYSTGLGLEQTWMTEAVVDGQDLDEVRLMAIAAYQAMLDHYPTAVQYAADQSFFFRLATPAYLGVERLGGVVQGDWVLVADLAGNPVAVQGGSAPVNPPDIDPADEDEGDQ